MSEPLLIAIFGIIAVAVGGLYALMIQHIGHCSAVHGRLARQEGKVERLERDIGDHGSGIRGELHAHSNTLTEHAMRLQMLDKFEGGG